MARKQLPLRWTVAAALSFMAHLCAGGLSGVAWPGEDQLPRIRLQEVVGIPVEPEGPQPPPEKRPGSPAAPGRAASSSKASPAEAAAKAIVVPTAQPAPPVEKNTSTEVASSDPAPDRAALLPRKVDAPEPPPPPTPTEESTEAPAREKTAAAPVASTPGSAGSAGSPGQPTDRQAPALPEDLLELPPSFGAGAESQLDKLLTGGAKVVLHVRTQELTKSPNAGALRRTMRAVAGYDLYLGSSGFDPLTDFEWMVVRTPDLSSVTNTLLVARLAVSMDRARAAVERIPPRGNALVWEAGESGARRAVLAGNGAVVGAGESSRAWRQLGWALADEPESLFIAGPRRWVAEVAPTPAKLARGAPMEQLAEVRVSGEPADFVLVTSEIRPFLSTATAGDAAGAAGPVAQGAILAVRFRDDAVLVARLWFDEPAAARRFVLETERQMASLNEFPLARLLDLPSMARRMELHQQGSEATAWVHLEPAQLARLLNLATMLLRNDEDNGPPAKTQSN